MRQLYIMFCFSDTFGGGQSYVNTKVKWLEKRNWDVIIFSAVEDFSNKLESPWDALRKYRCYRSEMFNHSPEYCGKRLTNRTLDWMQNAIGTSYGKVVIESHTDFFAEWGELLAKRIRAKHICYLLDEKLELYGAKEFLYYKYLRGEVAGIAPSSLKRLFDGYIEISEDKKYVLRASHEESVKEVENEQLNKLEKEDYTVAYMGRSKQYCANIVQGIKSFAQRHNDKTIQFVIMGKINDLSVLQNINNIRVVELGFLNPIPKAFFTKVDAAIAGAGCATIAANNGAYTIVADAASCLASGVLGYTVQTTLFSERQGTPFEDELENVLVRKLYDKQVCQFHVMSEVDKSFQKHFDFINASAKQLDYFDFDVNPQNNIPLRGKRDIYNRFRYIVLPDITWECMKKQRKWQCNERK